VGQPPLEHDGEASPAPRTALRTHLECGGTATRPLEPSVRRSLLDDETSAAAYAEAWQDFSNAVTAADVVSSSLLRRLAADFAQAIQALDEAEDDFAEKLVDRGGPEMMDLEDVNSP
jgi:hypothetical protein